MINLRSFVIAFFVLMSVNSMLAQEFDKKGLMYRITSTENKTVDLIGFEKKAKDAITIPEEVSYKGDKYSVNAIGENAFMDCATLTRVIATSVQVVKDRAFQGCLNLVEVSFTDNLTEIMRNSFNGCTALTTISLGNNIQSIGDAAFSGCSNLSEISLGANLKAIGKGFINGTKITTIVLPNSLTRIGSQIFAGNNVLTGVTFGKALSEIGKSAFENTSITSANFPNSLTKIDEKAFCNCDKLVSVTWSNSLSFIGNSAFEGVGISELVIPSSIKKINPYTFANCKSLKKISLNEELEFISGKAFMGCSLLSVDLTDCMADVADDSFEGCKEAITADYSLKGIAKYLKSHSDICKVDYKGGFATLVFSNNSKCEVISKYGKVISTSRGYVVSDGLIMVPERSGLVLKNVKGKVLSEYCYDDIYNKQEAKFVNGFLKVKRNNMFGIINTKGEEIVSCKYNKVEGFKDGLAKVYLNGKIGMVNNVGNIVIPYEYDYISDFSAGIASARKGEKWGFIDTAGKVCIPIIYEEVSEPTEGDIIPVYKDGYWGCVNKTNRVVVPFNYFRINAFHDGLALVEKDLKNGFIDQTGRVAIPIKYSYAADFENNITCVSIPDEKKEGWLKPGIIDKSGKVLYPFSDVEIERAESGLYIVKKNNEITIIGVSGVVGTFTDYGYLEMFSSADYIYVRKGNKSGVINKDGKFVVPMELSDNQIFADGKGEVICMKDKNGNISIYNSTGKIRSYSSSYRISANTIVDEYITLTNDDKYGLIGETGEEIVPCLYSNIKMYNGYLICCKDNLYGVLDKSGKEIIPFKYQNIFCYDNGLAVISSEHGIGFVDINGKSTFDY